MTKEEKASREEPEMERHPGGRKMTRQLLSWGKKYLENWPRKPSEGGAYPYSAASEGSVYPYGSAPEDSIFTKGLAPSALDLGAGSGAGVRLLREYGFRAVGIDLNPGPDVEKGDISCCPYPSGSFDLILSECVFFCSGKGGEALREAKRLLKPGGLLLIGDVWFSGREKWERTLEEAGFEVKELQDITPVWREYYISCIWNGTAGEWCSSGCGFSGKDCRYYLTAALSQ